MPHLAEEIVAALAAVLTRHPDLPQDNLTYNRNLYDLMRRAFSVRDLLGARCHPFTPRSVARFGSRFHEVVDAQIDDERVAALRALLLRQCDRLGERPLHGMLADLRALKAEAASHPQEFRKNAAALIRVAPLLYDGQGAALFDSVGQRARSRIASVPAGELDNLYSDLFAGHLAPLLIDLANERGLGQVSELTQRVLNRFIPADVLPALQLYASDSRVVTTRALSLEEIPAPVSIFRGALAGDCSMVSVPFYALLSDVHCYWLRKGDGHESKPAGYAFVVAVEVEGERLPYIVTINGVTLTSADVRAAIVAIAGHWQTRMALLPDLTRTAYLINTRAVAEGYESFAGQPLEARLPEGWEILEAYHDEQTPMDNFYRAGALAAARRVVAQSEDLHHVLLATSSQVTYARAAIAGVPRLDRALIACYADASGAPQEEKDAVLSFTAVDSEQLAAARVLVDATVQGTLSSDGLRTLKRVFDLPLDALSRLGTGFLATNLRRLYDDCGPLFADTEWGPLVGRVNAALRRELEEGDHHLQERDELAAAKISLPDRFVVNYWQENRPLFELPGGGLDYYRINRFVPLLGSYATVVPLLALLDEAPEIVSSIDCENLRWAELWRRARQRLDGEPNGKHHETLRRLVAATYGAALGAPPATTSAYHRGQAALGMALIDADDFGALLLDRIAALEDSGEQRALFEALLRYLGTTARLPALFELFERRKDALRLMTEKDWQALDSAAAWEPEQAEAVKHWQAVAERS